MYLNLNSRELLAHKENINPTLVSKEKAIIHNNLVNSSRTFGKELFNAPSRSGLAKPASLTNLLTTANLSKHQCSVLEVKASSMSMIPEEVAQMHTVKDPLLNFGDTNSYINNSSMSMTIETTNDSKRMSIEKPLSFTKPANLGSSFARKTQLPLDIEPADLERIDNPQCVVHYAKEVSDYMKETEEKWLAKPNYISKCQKDINEKMRAIMIDWLIDVHLKFKLLPETLYLTVNLIDRYLELVPVTRHKLQLVGVACMLIACKYEEIYSPEVKDFVYVTDKAYSRQEVLEMEGKVLSTLKFQLTAPSSFRFFERFAQLAKVNEKAYHIGCYLLELSLIEYKMMRYTPSMLACSALYIGLASEGNAGWNDVLVRNSRYEEPAVRNCARELSMLAAPLHEKIALTAARRKYTLAKYGEVSKIDLSNFQ